MRNRYILLWFFMVVGLPLMLFSQKKEYKILFVGNSLTYSNDLPSMVTELAALDSIRITHKSFALPDYSLEDHWNEGRVEDEIGNGHYDYVVLQQGPSALDESRVLLIEYAKRFAEVCKKARAKPVMFMVWPSKARLFDLDRVIKNYTDAAKESGSVLCPAGLAWKFAWKVDPGLGLYSFDGFHPSLTGSLLAALTIYAGIKGSDNFKKLDTRKLSSLKELSRSTLENLENSADRAIKNPADF